MNEARSLMFLMHDEPLKVTAPSFTLDWGSTAASYSAIMTLTAGDDGFVKVMV
jgi:hypothetical protein